MTSSSPRWRLCGSTIIVSLVVVIALLVPPAVSKTHKARKGDGDRDARQVIEVAASCTSKCRDMCAALPKSEDPFCNRRCDSMSIFNTGVVDPATLDKETASIAVQEIQMCSNECYLWCTVPDAASSCKDRCTATFLPFGPALAVLGKTMAASGLAGPAKPHAPGKEKDASKPFEACSEACNRKCAARGTKECGGGCAEACGLYAAATTVLKDAMPPAAVPSPAAVGDDAVANIFKACSEHCTAKDKKKCTTKCAFACYMVNKAKASMKLASGSFSLPA